MKRNLAWILALVAFAGFASFATAQEEEPAKELEGYVQPHGDGMFLNVVVENNNLTVYIYDEKKEEKQQIPWNRARIQYQPPSNQRQSTFMSRAEDGLSLRSGHVVRRPIAFQFWLYLFEEGKEEASLTVTGRIVQPMPGDGESVSLYELLEAGKSPNG
ncbi:MAG TPA: hypothetical protein VIK52_00615 [Opitutaceae bacterium]